MKEVPYQSALIDSARDANNSDHPRVHVSGVLPFKIHIKHVSMTGKIQNDLQESKSEI